MATNENLERMAISRKNLVSLTLPDFPKVNPEVKKKFPYLAALFEDQEKQMSAWREKAQYVLNNAITTLKHFEEEVVEEEAVVEQTITVKPGDAIVSETSFGQDASPGVSDLYARMDHTHGTPDNPMQEHLDSANPHPQYALVVSTDDTALIVAMGGAF